MNSVTLYSHPWPTNNFLYPKFRCDIAYKTTLNDVLDFPPGLIEHQLAHSVRDPLGRAYNRTKHLKQRREMMQKWADYLDGLRGAHKNPVL